MGANTGPSCSVTYGQYYDSVSRVIAKAFLAVAGEHCVNPAMRRSPVPSSGAAQPAQGTALVDVRCGPRRPCPDPASV